MQDRELEHRQAQCRKDDSGYDETFPRGHAFIDVDVRNGAVHRSTVASETDSPHIPCEFRHPTQLLGEGEFARIWLGIFRGILRLESVGKLGGEKRDVSCGCQEYPTGAA